MAHEKRVVIAFGRFNPPTTGHEALVTFLTQTAHRMGAEARVYPSPTTDAKKNPLPFREKVGFLRQLFPHVTINDNPAMNTPFAAFADASAAGYKDITVIVGADRVRDFESFAAYLLPANSPKYNAAKHIDVSHYRVLAIPRGIGAMSATLMRGYVIANDFPSFLAGTPGKNVAVAKKLFASLRQHMHIREQQDYRNAMRQKVQEAEVASSLKKQGRLLDEGKDYSMVVVDPDGGSPSWKRGGHGHTPVPKVVWQMHSLDASELKDAVELAHKAHPKLNVSIENKSGRVIRVVKPGQKFTEAARMSEDHIKVGDAVHAGLATLGGHGFKGTVDKIDGNWVYVIIGKDKYGDRIIKAPMRTVTVMKEANAAPIREARMPLKGHPYHKKTDTELRYIIKDAGEAAKNMRGHNRQAEDKYADQVNDAQTVLYYRKNGGLKEASIARMSEDHLKVGDRAKDRKLFNHGTITRIVGDEAMLNIGPLKGREHSGDRTIRVKMSDLIKEADTAPKPPGDVDRLKVRQATDTINLKQRQATELMAAKIRDVETKAREAQTKATAPKGAAV